ncbi:unnamed protein product [Rotaria sordida]|uniref:N-acetylgalactosaminide beta-1,3-galactosyltransferase n=1 Tax=Rotaria sordida TaxID=392033 RepID=A0A815Q8J2_9BILA|nr:unnamed protein product [Rotaria sordida]CAF1521812.1 unnamed protein product [Rotaria sordida]
MRPCISTIGFNYRSLLSVQILSFSIGFFCITYLILSNFSQVSVEKRQDINHVVRSESKSFICDRMRKNDGTREINVSSELDDHLLNILRPYCDVVPIPRKNWIPAKRYIESDIVFIIYTGAYFYHSRATAVRDTWLSRVTHKYFFSQTPYPSLPVTVIENAGETYLSNIKKIYSGMQIAYQNHSRTAKFYFLAECDTFVNVPHLLKRLESFDYKQPVIIGGFPNKHTCYIKRNVTNYISSYLSGGAGFFLSARMMKLMIPKLNSYFEDDWPVTEDKAHADAALNCLAHSMGIKSTLVPGFWKFNPEKTLKDNGKEKFYADPEPNTFHRTHPLAMHVLDEFYIHQLLDRLGNDKNFDELMKFTRQFVITHYELLRIKIRECILPPIETTKHYSSYSNFKTLHIIQ